jgi:hypothetical protein
MVCVQVDGEYAKRRAACEAVLATLKTHRPEVNTLDLFFSFFFVYIYIYICVCVCVWTPFILYYSHLFQIATWRDAKMADLMAVQGQLSDEYFRRGRHVITEIVRAASY